MVLCQYYLNGSCRFGAKCINEHFDVRQIIKSEIEAALKGAQWPLSCFGPFKEKPCLPNFITDQSFEEIRHLCYESKKQQNIQAYAQQFTQQVMDGQNKMKALLSLSRDVVDVVVNLYNSGGGETNQVQGQQQQTSNNPFSLSDSFVAAPQTNSKSLFGNSTTQSNPFANSTFGSTMTQNAGSIFGGAQISGGTNAGRVFGQSAFGSANSAFTGQQQSSLFVGGGQQQTHQAGNAFVGMAAQQTTPFGTAGNNAFGGAPNPPQTNIFSQQNNQMLPTGIFAQQSQQQQAQGFGTFTQPTQAAQSNVFGVAQCANVFGQGQQPAAQTAFGMAATAQQQNSFGQPQQQVTFGGGQPTNVFGAPQQQQQNNAMESGGSFGGGQTNAFQQNVAQPFGAHSGDAAVHVQDTTYSRIEDLTAEALEAFKAPDFVLGKLPTMPPPRELCG